MDDNCQTDGIMFLESLELHNFKSFGNRKKVVFKKGFTVISGPNGSGKSNIGDSLLFVLGIRSSKAVRAERLGDLIHKTSDDKRNRDYCSVSVTIDTEDQEKLPEERKITLKRELVAEMDGYKSNYYLNGIKVRHSDVAELLDSLHIYLDSYSFVLQGDINNIVKMTGFERRKLLESISGIESFDVQIQKAEGDIQGINENLGRLDLLAQQTEKRKQELEVEKDVAERYQKISDHIRDLKQTILNIEKTGMMREIYSHSSNIDSIRREIDEISKRISGLQASLEEKRNVERDLKEKLEVSGNSQLMEIRSQIENKRVKVAELGIMLDNTRDHVAGLKSQIRSESDEMGKSESKLQWLNSNRKENSQTLSDIRKNIARISADLRALREQNSRSSSEILRKQTIIKEKDEQIRVLNSELESKQELKDQIQAERTRIIGELSSLEEKKKDTEFQVRDALWRLKEIERESGNSRQDSEKLNFRYYDLKKQLEELRKSKDSIQSELNSAGREHAQIQAQISARSGGVNRALSTIMQARNKNSIQGIHGTIRELITFPEEFRAAVESSAGGRLNSIVVEDDAVAQECLELLKREKAGKLTFLPLNKVLGGRPRGKAITVRSSEGSLGYVFEKISFDRKYEGIVWYAVQDTVIVRDVPTARKYMVGVRLVTLDGDIFEASGAITGGFQERTKSSSDQEAKLAELTAKIRDLSARLDEVTSRIPEIEEEFDAVSQKLRDTSKNEGSKNAEILQWKKLAEEGKPKLEQMALAISSLNEKLQSVDRKISDSDLAIREARVKISKIEAEKSAIFDEIRDLAPQYAEKETQLENEISRLREKEAEFAGELVKIDADIEHIRMRDAELAQRISSYESELARGSEDIEKLSAQMAQEKLELEKLRKIEEEISERSREIVNALNANEAEISRIEDTMEMEKASITTKNEIILSANLKIENLQSRVRDIEDQMAANGGNVLEDRKFINEARKELESSSSELAALGPVNQKAVTEFQEVSRDLDSLKGEIDNLSAEKIDLEKLTEKLNQQKRKIFLEIYSAINENMKIIYRELSGGGEASLEMSEESDPLNSEIYIRARPKGKSYSKLEALSGGEKSLTALAFIMAVQRINPSPIYYLDEVDMFLDGSNAERVGKQFKINSGTSQVFAVSLRKAMLKYADHVIGVTSFDGENTEVFEKSVSESGNMEVEN